MRAIPPRHVARHDLTVTPAMTVDFEQADARLGRVHAVYATYHLTQHMELASRKIILPFLDDDEEGIGHEVQVTHLSSALPGMALTITATFERREGNRVYAACRAVSELGDLIGTGSTTQVILRKDSIERNLARLRQRWREHGGRP